MNRSHYDPRKAHVMHLDGAAWYRQEAQDIHPDDQQARRWCRNDCREYVRMARRVRQSYQVQSYLPR